MGVDYTVNVGPYVIIKDGRQKVKEEFLACDTKGCERFHSHYHGHDKFCAACGKEIKQVVEEKFKVDYCGVLDELDDALTTVLSEYPPKGYEHSIILIPNRTKPSSGFSFDHRSDGGIYEFPDSDTIFSFLDSYADELKKLREMFPETEVKVKIGVISWAS